MGPRRLTLLGAACLSLCGAPAAAAASPDVAVSPAIVRPGERVVVEAGVAERGRFCRATVTRGEARQSTAWSPATRTHMRWAARVARDARAGRWSVAVTCRGERSDTAVASVRVRGGGSASRLFAALPRGRASGDAQPAAEPAPAAAAESAPATPPPTPSSIVVVGNPMQAGQCTWWAYERRPDIFLRAAGADSDFWSSWNAGTWDDHARRSGFRVDRVPVAGAIAVWEPYVGAGQYGHVAYVESVSATREPTVSEMNFNGSPDVTTRTLSAADVAVVSFIHE